jgi:hypothetical protein
MGGLGQRGGSLIWMHQLRWIIGGRTMDAPSLLFQDIADYIRISKDTIDLLKGAFGLLPKGAKRDEAEQKIKAAEEALKRADVTLAQKLGYSLCGCTYPPQIMLWREQQKLTACPNPSCGRTIKDFNRPIEYPPRSYI